MASLTPAGEISQIVPIDTCLNCSLTRLDRTCDYDFADLYARREVGYDESFSPSRFLGCDRELYLRANNDFWTDPKEQSYRVRGSATHRLLENDDPRCIVEARVYRTLPGAYDHLGRPAVVSVKPDVVYPSLKQIHDTKTYKYLPRGNVERGKVDPIEVRPAYIAQLSVGAWAWAKPDSVQYDPARREENPDPIEITTGQIIIRDSTTQIRLSGLKLTPADELEDWMRGRVLELNAVRLGTLPGYCAEDLRWKCGTCPVAYICGVRREHPEWFKKKESKVGTTKGVRKPAPR